MSLQGTSRTVILLTGVIVLVPCAVWYVIGSKQVARETARMQNTADREAALTAKELAARLAARLDLIRDEESERTFDRFPPIKPDRGIDFYFRIDEQGRVASSLADPSMAAISRDLGAIARAADGQGAGTKFQWKTARIGGNDLLVGLRRRGEPGKEAVEGFAISSGCVSRWHFNAPYVASLRPSDPTSTTSAKLPISGATWHVFADPRRARDETGEQRRLLEAQFHQSFLGGGIVALLAALWMVRLIFRFQNLARAQTEFAVAAAHELRTPLASIRLHSEMLAEALGHPARAAEYARRIATESQRLGRLVANVLAYTRAHRGRLRLQLGPGDLGASMRAGLESLAPVLARNGAELLIDIPEGLPPVSFDADSVQQMLQNLVDNAEKYTRDSKDRRIEVRLGGGGDAVLLEVRDHGAGLDPAVRGRLFQAFGTGDDGKGLAGLGLGLAMVRALAHAHGATLEHRETPGGGATFAVRFTALRR